MPHAKGYVIETAPAKTPPEGEGLEHVDPVRWFWRARHAWTTKKAEAHVFESAGKAIDQISELRDRVMGVEFALVPCGNADVLRGTPGPKRG